MKRTFGVAPWRGFGDAGAAWLSTEWRVVVHDVGVDEGMYRVGISA